MQRIQVATKILPFEVEALDRLIAAKHPGRTRGDFIRTLIENELNRQGDQRIDEILNVCQEIRDAVVKR